MADRLNLSGFKPSGRIKGALGGYIDLCVNVLGGSLWDPMPHPSEEDRYREAETLLPELRDAIRFQLNLSPSGDNTIALLDWTALDRATTLLECGGKEVKDPFVAFADFSAVLSAMLFFDRVVVLDSGQAAADRANRVFGLDKVFASVEGRKESATGRMLDHHYSWAWHAFNNATEHGMRWIDWLQEGWRQLLPDASFPRHKGRDYEAALGYNTSPNRQSWIDVLFHNINDAWRLRPDSTRDLILDNDLRALIYERLAQTLEAIASETDRSRSVCYIGGCLRMPLLMARRRLADASLEGGTEIPEWLQQKWRELYSPSSEAVEMPFWTAALLSRVADRQGLPEAIRKMRQRAAPLRARRTDFDSALRDGRTKEIDSLAKAVAGDVKGLAGWLSTGSDLTSEVLGAGATALLKTHAPGVPTELVAPVKKAAAAMGGADWLAKIAVRLFRPHLYFIMTMTKDSRAMQHTIRRAASVFEFRGRESSEALTFLQHLGTMTMST